MSPSVHNFTQDGSSIVLSKRGHIRAVNLLNLNRVCFRLMHYGKQGEDNLNRHVVDLCLVSVLVRIRLLLHI
ncbi:Uncharacterized protein RDABS01_015250 [Bienertia sinuspersici]